jgi:CPA1 family monovalent cation:H+ antiporter
LACKSNKTFLRLLRTYAIGIEKHTFKKLYERGEINEKAYRTLLEKLDHQIEMITKDMKNIYSTQRPEKTGFENFIHTLLYGKDIKHDTVSLYMYYRALRIASRKVVKVLSSIAIQSHLEEYDKKHYLHDIVEKYEDFFVNSTKKMKSVKKLDPNIIDKLNKQFARTEIAKTEEDLLHELYERDMITSKINLKLHDEIASDKI